MIQNVAALKAELQMGNVSRPSYDESMEDMGADYITEVRAKLEAVAFQTKAWCLRCQRQCFLSPRRGLPESLGQALWIEVA